MAIIEECCFCEYGYNCPVQYHVNNAACIVIRSREQKKEEDFMTVACKNIRCPFHSEGFCKNKSVRIDENGMCSEIWRKGQPSNIVPAVEPVHLDSTLTLEGNISDFDARYSDLAAYQE